MSQQNFARDVSVDGVRGSGDNVLLGTIAGGTVALIGAGVWMAFHIVYVALGIGVVVGLAVRLVGNGRHAIFGLIAVTCTVLGCVSGEVLARLQSATSAQHNFWDTMTNTDIVQMVTVIITQASTVDYGVYAISLIAAYMLSMRG